MLGVVLLIPLFYGGIFLWSMWNPVDNVNNMPVAVVNEDQGAETPDHENLNAGQKIVDNLHNNDRVDWRFVDEEEASKGLTDGKYFVTVTIPEDFSRAVTSIGTDTPRRGLLEVNYNDASGSTARQIVERIVQNLRESVSSSIGAQAADKLFGSIDQISEGVDKAANGSGQINDGAQKLNTSVRDELAPGANKLKDSVQNQLAPGAKELSDGINNQLVPGVTRLNSSVRDELAPGASKLADGNRQLATGMEQLNGSVAALRESPVAMSIPQVRELVDGVEKLNAGAAQTAAGAEKLSNGINQQLLPGTEQLQTSVTTSLAPGAQKLSDGINDQLVPGVSKLADGISTQLVDGTGKLAAGTSELSHGLNDASGQIPRYNPEQAQNNGSVIVNPVGVNENWIYQQKNNGEGMAPYFAALALFIGAIFTWQALRPLSRRALVARVSAFRALMHSLAPGLLLSSVQAVLLVTVAALVFHLPVNRWIPAFGILLLAGWMFTALQQMFAIWLGNAPGRLLSIIFLLVNLGSAGGTYPLQTLPEGLRSIGPVLPFYHVVQGLREAMIGAIGSDYWSALSYLGIGLVVCIALSMFGASQRKVFTMRQLRPVIPTA
ncbi:ABC transporter permease [Corynebacterium sp. 4HC-13]|nr:ABC transporter permease [Corynebacterium anserum]